MVDTKSRYRGIQELFKTRNIGAGGCYLLCLCSIAEEVTGKPADLIGAMDLDVIGDDCFIKDPIEVLQFLTGRTVTMRVENQIPNVVKAEEYTVLKYFNKRTGYTHFKRRGFDTLQNSVTVKEGNLVNCYVFTIL